MKKYNEIDDIKDFLYQNKVKFVKFNHSVDSDTQRFSQFNSYFQLSTDFKYMEIINKRPIDQPIEILQMDPREYFKKKAEFMRKRMADIKRQNSGFIKSNIDVILTPEEAEIQGVEHDVLLQF